MKKYFSLILTAVFIICTAQTCVKEDTPKPVASLSITADGNNKYLIYDRSLETPRSVKFTIDGADESTVYTATAQGIETEVEEIYSGTSSINILVTMTATEAFTDNSELVVTATSATSEKSVSYPLSRAKMEVAQTLFDDIPSAGQILPFDIDCNIDADITVEEGSKDMLSLAITSDNKLTIIVAKNPNMESRTGRILLTDIDGIIPEVAVTVNQNASAIPEVLNEATDRQALHAICEALHMQDWLDDTECIKWDRPIREWNTTFTGERIQRLGLGNAGRDIIHYGIIPDELGWLNYMTMLEISDEITGPLPKTLGGCKSLTNLTMYGSAKIAEKLNDSSIKDVIGHLYTLMLAPGYYGSFPEWFANMPERGHIYSSETHLSGQIPDRVANMKPMQKDWALGLTILDAFIVRAKSYYNYALWVGEQPSNVKFVDDEHDGHWEWTDTVFDETTQRWKQENDIYSEDCTFWYKEK